MVKRYSSHDYEERAEGWLVPHADYAALEARCREQSGANIEFLQTWMRTANPMLGGAVPLDMMYQGMGRRVAQFIDSAFTAETAVKP